MASTTFEEASRCPKCSNPGEEQINERRSGVDKSTIHIFRCQNGACRWFDTDWIVQRLEDGTVPIREPGPKSFPEIKGMTTGKAIDYIRNIPDDPTRRRR